MFPHDTLSIISTEIQCTGLSTEATQIQIISLCCLMVAVLLNTCFQLISGTGEHILNKLVHAGDWFFVYIFFLQKYFKVVYK